MMTHNDKNYIFVESYASPMRELSTVYMSCTSTPLKPVIGMYNIRIVTPFLSEWENYCNIYPKIF